MPSIDEKIDNAVHAAMRELGLSVETHTKIAELINDALTGIVFGITAVK